MAGGLSSNLSFNPGATHLPMLVTAQLQELVNLFGVALQMGADALVQLRHRHLCACIAHNVHIGGKEPAGGSALIVSISVHM
jgi:hypothetical protein